MDYGIIEHSNWNLLVFLAGKFFTIFWTPYGIFRMEGDRV